MNEIVELMGRVNHPVRVDDLLRFLDLSRRERKVLESALEMLETEGRILRLRGAAGLRRNRPLWLRARCPCNGPGPDL